jgi:hypothetical protein
MSARDAEARHRFARHPDLGAALSAAGLGPADAVAPG